MIKNKETQKLILTRGMSNSGKTTWALKWVAENPKIRRRTNRDDVRSSGFTIPSYKKKQEELVSNFQIGAVRELLESGFSVVVDAMHLRTEHVTPYFDLAYELGIEFVIKDDFEITLDEAISRMKKRHANGGLMVPVDSLTKMYYKDTNEGKPKPLPDYLERIPAVRRDAYLACINTPYVPDESLPKAVIVDIDGTLTQGIHPDRGAFEWEKVGLDEPNDYVINLVKLLSSTGATILITSGRSNICREETNLWLNKHDIPYDHLFMRNRNDHVPDQYVKSEIFEREMRHHYNIISVFDDRGRVCRLWHALKLPLLRVGDPFSDF